MHQPIRRFNNIVLRPHWTQYIISQGFMLIISVILYLLAGYDPITIKAPFYVAGSITTLIMRTAISSSVPKPPVTARKRPMSTRSTMLTITAAQLSILT